MYWNYVASVFRSRNVSKCLNTLRELNAKKKEENDLLIFIWPRRLYFVKKLQFCSK